MKNVKFLFTAACSLFAFAAMAQDFSDPKYAIWGETPEERQQNILNSNFLKESCDNKDYNAAAHYFKELVDLPLRRLMVSGFRAKVRLHLEYCV